MANFGPIALFGSGETAPGVQKIHHAVMKQLSPPVKAAILETPAGFEPNADGVARKIGNYLTHRLQNFEPEIRQIAARKVDTDFSPNDPQIAEPILRSNYLFMGPGSPTYAARQLMDSYTWHAMQARHRLGGAICFSSATTLAVARHTIPIYEIYKVGEDLHWKKGLDFFGPFGLNLVIVPHWNNNDGGEDLDTSHCYIGTDRYNRLIDMLPKDEPFTILGIEETTGIVIDPETGNAEVIGPGAAVIVRDGEETRIPAKERFSMSLLGDWHLPEPSQGIPEDVWQKALAIQQEMEEERSAESGAGKNARQVSDDVSELLEERETARQEKDWGRADELRDAILAEGWQVIDTPDGPVLEPQ